MVEARAKKAAFLREVARELNLANVNVVNLRLEDWSPILHSAHSLRRERYGLMPNSCHSSGSS